MPCSGDNKNDDATGLTSREKEAIRQSWKLVNADPEKSGVELLVRLFKERPSTQIYFNKFGNLTEEQMRENSMVRDHAANVMLSITNLVTNLDNEQRLIESLQKLSTIHHEQKVDSQDIRILHDKFGNLTEEQMRENSMVKDHAANVMLSITNLVTNLDNEQRLIESLQKLSTIHHEQKVDSQDIRFILSLLRRLMKDSLGDEYDVFTDESWTKCCDVIWSVIDVEMGKLKS